MIVVRNVFQLKFGKAREAKEAMTTMLAINKRIGQAKETRVLTDVTGPFYTMVLELSFPSLSDLERGQAAIMADAAWKDAYAKIVPLIESGHREIFSIVE
ncbi:MAG: NIPSNAP family protein [Thermoanaerobaculia bacterium]